MLGFVHQHLPVSRLHVQIDPLSQVFFMSVTASSHLWNRNLKGHTIVFRVKCGMHSHHIKTQLGACACFVFSDPLVPPHRPVSPYTMSLDLRAPQIFFITPTLNIPYIRSLHHICFSSPMSMRNLNLIWGCGSSDKKYIPMLFNDGPDFGSNVFQVLNPFQVHL